MSVEYPSDYPKTREEAVRAVLSIRDEDFARGARVGGVD